MPRSPAFNESGASIKKKVRRGRVCRRSRARTQSAARHLHAVLMLPQRPRPPPPLGGRPRSSSRCRPSPRPGTRPTTLYTSCAQSRCWRWMTLWSAWCRWAGIQVWPSSSVSHQGIPLRQQRLGLGGPALLPPLLCLPPSAALHARRVRNARRRSQVAFAAMVCPPGNSVPQSHCLSDQKWRTRSAMTCRLLTPQAS